MANSKHILTPSQTKIQPHTKGLLSSVLLTGTSCPAFSKKLHGILKEKKNNKKKPHRVLRDRASTRMRHGYCGDVGIITPGI